VLAVLAVLVAPLDVPDPDAEADAELGEAVVEAVVEVVAAPEPPEQAVTRAIEEARAARARRRSMPSR